MLVLWRKPLNVETADYVQIPWVWPRGILPKTQKRSNAPRAGHAFATNPLLSPWVALGLPGGRPLGMAADTRITIVGCVSANPSDGKMRRIMITKTKMVVIFDFQNSHLLSLFLSTKEVYQVNGQNRPEANLPVVDFHSLPREMPTPKPLNI